MYNRMRNGCAFSGILVVISQHYWGEICDSILYCSALKW